MTVVRYRSSWRDARAPQLSVYLWWGHFVIPPWCARRRITGQVGLSGIWAGRTWALLWAHRPTSRGRS